MKRRFHFLVLASAMLSAAALYAHHSVGATYDGKKEVKLEGKLIQFNYRNPHSFVHIDAPDPNGVMQRWAIEWGGASALGTQGVTRNTLRIGDVVIITGNPSRTPSDNRVKMNTLTRPADGLTWGTRPGEVVD